MAALVAAALAQVGDRPAHLAAILADRHRAPGVVIAAALLALAGVSAIAAVGGVWLAPGLTPEALQLVLSMALLLQGGGALWPVDPPEQLARWRLGVFATSLLGLAVLLFGDGTVFVVVAMAARSETPWFAGIGATLGGLAVLATAALIGEKRWLRAPQLALRRVIGGLFLLAGLWIGLSGLRLV